MLLCNFRVLNMKSQISNQPKPMRFKNYTELKENAQMDRRLLMQLKKYDIKRLYENFVSIENNARMRRQQGDEEESFILYQRAMEIFRLICDNMDDKFKRSNDGRKFHDISNTLFLAISLLAENLKLRYENQTHINIITQIENDGKPKPEKEFHIVTQTQKTAYTYIKPVELVRQIEHGNALVLVVDYRRNQDRFIEFKSATGTMDMIHFDPTSIVYGSLLNSLTQTLDISARPFMEKISRYDLVILLGDLDDIAKENCSKTCILYAALTTHNLRSHLKNPPLVLEQGFESWELAYPSYVTTEHYIPQFEKTFDEQFANWMEESRKNNKLEINYPNLNTEIDLNPSSIEKNKPSCRNDFPFQRNHRNYGKTRTNLASIEEEFGIQTKHHNEPELSFKSNIHQERIADKDIPDVDRSKKPAELAKHKITKESTFVEATEDIMHDKENCEVVKAKKRLALPQVQTLGGARIASIHVEPSAAAITPPIIHAQPSKPPTPDRSTKKAITQQSQPYDEHFQNSYLMALEKISEDSAYKRGETKPGCSGLVNMGNTCFMNSTLQALFHTPGFYQLFQDKFIGKYINPNNSLGTRGIISGCFAALIDLARSGQFFALRPYFFLQIFARRVNSTLADRQQHDAQEFQIYLLDALHEDTNRVDKRRPFEQNYDNSNLVESAQDFMKQSSLFSSSPVNDIFNLTTVSVLQCKACKATSVCFEGLNQISVELPQYATAGALRLRDCLSTHFSTTLLDTPWDCPRCKCKQTATRTTKIWNTPKILIIHLKRFSFNSGHFVKNEVDVNFEIENLLLTPYIHAKAPQTPCKARYNLYAVTNHSGSLNSGHYTSFVKNQQEWLYFDDENCTRRNPSAIASKQAFLLYYALSDTC